MSRAARRAGVQRSKQRVRACRFVARWGLWQGDSVLVELMVWVGADNRIHVPSREGKKQAGDLIVLCMDVGTHVEKLVDEAEPAALRSN